jgi:hypothetical protein
MDEITNGEKFKTAVERQSNFNKFCKQYKRCHYCPLGNPARLGICRFKWLDLEYEKPSRGMEDIIRELRELSSINPMPGALAIDDCISTIYGKPVRWYLADLADEIEAAWNRRV